MKPAIPKLIKENILDDFSQGNRTGLYALTQKLMAYNSNKIEGSTLTSEQTASLFDTGTITSSGIETYRAKDIEEMTGHFRMFDEMLKTLDEPMSPELICRYHYQLKNGVFEDMANGYPIGEFKNRLNIVSDIVTTRPDEVKPRLISLISQYENSGKTISDIAAFHAEYEHIHPFQDGNGRTGRMLIIKQCLSNDLIPVIIQDKDKGQYYQCLHKAQTEKDIKSLTSFFAYCQKQYLYKVRDFIVDLALSKHYETESTINKDKDMESERIDDDIMKDTSDYDDPFGDR